MNSVETLTLRLLDGEITDAEYEELRRLLAEDEEARQIHFALCEQEGLLRAQAADSDVVESTMTRLRAMEAEPVAPPRLPPPVAPAAVKPVSIAINSGRPVRSRIRRTRKSRPLLWFACTACVLLVAGGLAVYLDLSDSLWNGQVARALPPEPAQIASIGPGVQIERDGRMLDAATGLDLLAGDKISVPEESWATFAYEDATQVMLQPEAKAVFQPPVGEDADAASKRVLLNQGTLAAQVAKQSPGRAMDFATTNAAARVLGTRLVLATASDGTQLHVLQGQVQLTRSSDSASVKVSGGFSAVARPGIELGAQRTPDRVSQNLVTLFPIDKGSGTIVHDRSGNDPPLDLQLADALVAYWPFEEGAGTTTADISGNGHDGKVNGAVWTAGQDGSALEFDGSNDYVDAGKWDVGGDEMTISLWLNADSFDTSEARLISKSTDTAESAHYFMLSTFDSDGAKLRFRLKTDGTTSTLVASGGTLSTGQWTHAAAVYDGTSMKIYKDGTEVGRTAKAGTISESSTVPIWVGRNPNGYGTFDGKIDEVRIHSRALTAEEIAVLATPRRKTIRGSED